MSMQEQTGRTADDPNAITTAIETFRWFQSRLTTEAPARLLAFLEVCSAFAVCEARQGVNFSLTPGDVVSCLERLAAAGTTIPAGLAASYEVLLHAVVDQFLEPVNSSRFAIFLARLRTGLGEMAAAVQVSVAFLGVTSPSSTAAG